MSHEPAVAEHYTHGALTEAIRGAAKAAGLDPEGVTAADLAPADEFHIGGRQATLDFAAQLGFNAGDHLLDVGCGIGGPARCLAETVGCRVTGIDLTEEYVDTAAELSAWVGLDRKLAFYQGSALATPFGDAQFDGAYMLHVGMNIQDKSALFAEVARVVKPGATFGVYDVMRVGDAALTYPVPWAADEETSFLETPEGYRAALEGAGFEVAAERNRRDFAHDFFARLKARVGAADGPPPLGLHIVMGADAPLKVANMIANIEAGAIAPAEIVARKMV